MHKPVVFLDSSVLIAALLSGQGGSAYVLTQLREKFDFQINEFVLAEVQEILKTKFSHLPSMSIQLFLWMGVNPIIILENPAKKEVIKLAKYISKNDAPILASALLGSDYLLTLDNEFFGEKIIELANNKSLSILKPKELIEAVKTNKIYSKT
mgnify:FL=1